MNKNLLLPIIALFLVLSVSFVSAYEIEIANLDINQLNTTGAGSQADLVFDLINNGQDMPASNSNTITIDFGDGTNQTIDCPSIATDETIPHNFNKSYAVADDYVITVTFNDNDEFDSTPSNNEDSIIVTIPNANDMFSLPDFTFSGYENTEIVLNGTMYNDGNTNVEVGLRVTDLTENAMSPETISSDEFEIEIVGENDETAFFFSETQKTIGLTLTIPEDQSAGTYEGNLELYDASNPSNVFESSNITVTVTGVQTPTNNAPTISTIPTQTAITGQEFTFDVSDYANDVDGDNLWYYLNEDESPQGMDINHATGEIYNWFPQQIGTQTATIIVSDGIEQATTTFSIIVEEPVQYGNFQFDLSEIALGGENQERGEQTSPQTITITNTGVQSITNIGYELISVDDIFEDSDFQINVPNTISENGQVSVSVNVSEDKNSERETIAILRITGDNGYQEVSQTIPITLEAESYLEITDVEFEMDGDEIDEDEFIEGEEYTLTVNVENLYSSNNEIKQVYFEVEDTNWGIDETSNEMDLDDGDESDDELYVTFTLDDDLDDDTTVLTIKAYGEDDEEGFDHYDEYTVTLELTQENDDVRITKAEFDDDTLSTYALSADLEVEIENKGLDSQDEVEIKVECITSGLSYSETYEVGDDFDPEDDENHTFEISLPSNIQPGDYTFRVKVITENENPDDVEDVVLTITGTSSSTTTTTTTTNTGNSQTSTNTNTYPTNGDNSQGIINPVYGQESGLQRFSESDGYLIILGLAALIALSAIMYILFGMKPNKPKRVVYEEAPRKKHVAKKTAKKTTAQRIKVK